MLGMRNTWARVQVAEPLEGRPLMAVDELEVFTCVEQDMSVDILVECA